MNSSKIASIRYFIADTYHVTNLIKDVFLIRLQVNFEIMLGMQISRYFYVQNLCSWFWS